MKSCCREHIAPSKPSVIKRVWNTSFYLILLILALLILFSSLKTGLYG